MAHCSFEKLIDLEMAMSVIRAWEGMKETKPGIFYLKRSPFLHFHEKGERRWADVRSGKNWGTPIDVPFGARPSEVAKFLRAVELRYRKTLTSNL